MRFRLFACLAFIASAASAQPASRIAIDDFAALPSIGIPNLSPDGKRIAARSIVDSEHFLVVLDAVNPTIEKRIAIGEAKVSAIHWAGNTRLLLEILSETKIYGEEYSLRRMIILDLKTGNATVADPRSRGLYGGDVLYVSDDGSSAIVASQGRKGRPGS